MWYLDNLSKVQRQCVEDVEGPCMIIAGAGSGKTRVLTTRIAHIINHHNIDPKRIMALTFTKKAAEEMKSRIISITGEKAKNIWMGTFHSVFGKILRIEGSVLGYTSSYTVYDTKDSHTLIRRIIKEKNYDKEKYKYRLVANRISNAKTQLVGSEAYANHSIYLEDDKKRGRIHITDIYSEYSLRCKQANAMDFDDLLYHTNILFRDHLDILEKYQHKFHYLLVDEFQDTNISQYLILKKLSHVHRNICVVGDDAQSIYAFRGANIDNILSFEKDYNDTGVIRLEQNYRSTSRILALANNIIGNNKNQIKKKLWTDNSEGEQIVISTTSDDIQEAKLVTDSIYDDINNKGILSSEIAILYRTNRQSRVLEERFKLNSIPYIIFGGMSFYQREEVKDMLSYLRYVINPNDEEAFQRIINKPKRGIGSTSLAKIFASKGRNNQTLEEVLSRVDTIISGKIGLAIKAFHTMMSSIRGILHTNDAHKIATQVGQCSGLLDFYFKDKSVEGVNKFENLTELLSSIKSFVSDKDRSNEEKSLAVFLQEIALLTSMDNSEDKSRSSVKMMTIHMSKGLEFKNVYIVGVENDLFPSSQASTVEDIEEERRLFYVAVTRAKEKVSISACLKRFLNGSLKTCTPSQFLNELSDDVVNKVALKSSYNSNSRMQILKNGRLKSNIWNNKIQTSNKKEPNKYDITPSDPSIIKESMRVLHGTYGKGKVTKISNRSGHKSAVIKFDNEQYGNKILLLSFAKLQILEA